MEPTESNGILQVKCSFTAKIQLLTKRLFFEKALPDKIFESILK